MSIPQLPSGEEIVEGIYKTLPSEYGAMVVYTPPKYKGYSVQIAGHEVYFANVVERTVKGEKIYVAVFPRLRESFYFVELPEIIKGILDQPTYNFGEPYKPTTASVDVFPGFVAEVDFR